MINERIEAALAQINASADPLERRAILEDLWDCAEDDLIADLASSEDAAEIWHVSGARARAHIAKRGIGWKIGQRAWVLRRSAIEANRPRPYRRNETA